MTTTNALPLNTQAQAMLRAFHSRCGVVPAQVDAAITQASAAQVGGTTQVAIDCDALEKILLNAMPDQKQNIQHAKGCAATYHPDNKNGRFLTQILSMRIEKETHNVYAPPRPAPPVSRDPLYATFTMAPDADVMLLFNARDVDEKGQPLLMKIVARERVDVQKLDLSGYRIHPNGTQPDIVRVKDGASYVETKDIDEAEFSFGDPLKQVSLNAHGKELSTSLWLRPENIDRQRFFRGMSGPNGTLVPNPTQPVAQFDRNRTGENLDTTPVVRFDQRVGLSIEAQNLPAGAWLDTPNAGQSIKASLSVERGFIFEPGSRGEVSLSGVASGKVSVSVANDDAHLLGSAPGSTDIAVQPRATLRQLLDSQLNTDARTRNEDARGASKTLKEAVFHDAASMEIAGRALSPLGDVKLNAAGLAAAKLQATAKPLPRDPEEDGVKLSLTLEDAFLTATQGKDADFRGWTIVAGFTDVDGTWKEQSKKVSTKSSKKESMSFDLDDFDGLQKNNANLELRLFNKEGIPAQRVLIPMREIHWGV